MLHGSVGWCRRPGGVGGYLQFPEIGCPPCRSKPTPRGRHHIPRQRHRVTNLSEFDATLRRQGSLTVWFTEEATAAWRAEPRTTRGGQPHYSALAIATGLTLRAVYRLALRQTEELIGSIIRLLGLLDLAIPDHSTLSRKRCPGALLPLQVQRCLFCLRQGTSSYRYVRR